MTREKIAVLIYWNKIMWFVALLNPMFMLPQVYKIWETRNVSSISPASLWVLLFVQSGFTLHGYFRRDRLLLTSSGLGALVSIIVICSVAYLKH